MTRQSAGHLTVETADSVHRMACAIVWPNTYPELARFPRLDSDALVSGYGMTGAPHNVGR
ncbi:MAG: hypothetical protein IMF11_09810 [Proteobacteria bacterium]|nr:hypothetical protein [Pseudomonadota bacterium]